MNKEKFLEINIVQEKLKERNSFDFFDWIKNDAKLKVVLFLY